VSSLAKLIGGSVGVQSESGRGSRFWFRIRADMVAAEPGRQTPERRLRVATSRADGSAPFCGHVLVVEDNAVNCMVIKMLLLKLGLRVTVANNGQQAVDAITQGATPDAILMDLHMPVLDGYGATERIRQWEADMHRQGLPIIALTADAFEEDRQHCLAVGMNDFLTKPIAIEVLTSALGKWLPEACVISRPPTPLRSPDLQAFGTLMDELTPLLQQNKFAALSRFKQLQALTDGTALTDAIGALAPLMQDMRFDLVWPPLLEVAKSVKAEQRESVKAQELQ
jgi:CheY-like chemotaxis protein